MERNQEAREAQDDDEPGLINGKGYPAVTFLECTFIGVHLDCITSIGHFFEYQSDEMFESCAGSCAGLPKIRSIPIFEHLPSKKYSAT